LKQKINHFFFASFAALAIVLITRANAHERRAYPK
jgi:hypothetical protein